MSGAGTVSGAVLLLFLIGLAVPSSALRSSGISGCRYCWERLTPD